MESCLLCRSPQYRIIKKEANGRTIGMCTSCHFVQVYPHVVQRDYEAVHFDDWEHDNPYISQIDAHKQYFRTLLTYLHPFFKRSQITLLDVGCAIGALVMVANKEGIDAEGIDIAKTAVSYAKKRHLSVSQDTCLTWFRKKQYKNHYDVITALEVIEHEENPLHMMQIIYKMLRPGGIVTLTTPNFNTLFRIIMGNNWVGYQHQEHLWFFTPETITRLLLQTGFSDIHVRRDFYRPYSVSYMFRRLGDYVPFLHPITSFIASITKQVSFSIPFNPWADILIIAKK